MSRIKNALVASAMVGCLVPMAAQASATVSIDFNLSSIDPVTGYTLVGNEFTGIEIVNDCALHPGTIPCLAPTVYNNGGHGLGTPVTGAYVAGSYFHINILPGYEFDYVSLSVRPTTSSTVGVVTGDLTSKSIIVTSSGTIATWLQFDLGTFDVGNITSISFNQFVGLDNLVLKDLTPTSTGGSGSTGGSVPEPASFALAALALLGAGFNRRKHQV